MSEPGPSLLRRTFTQALDFLLFSNIFIALCAVAQAKVTYLLIGAECDKQVLGVLFFATIALYNFSMFMSKPLDPKSSPFRRVRWVHGNYRLVITITLISILSLLVIFLFLSTSAQILLLFLGIISVAYNLPLFSVDDKKFGLRNVPGLKLFLIALIWSLSCALLPIVELTHTQSIVIPANDTIILVAKRFLFIAAITIPFDIRDIYQDRNYNLKTIPVVIGERNSYLVCQILLFVYLILLFILLGDLNFSFFALSSTIFYTGWLILNSEREKNEYYYFLLLDGTMIIQFLVLHLSSVIEMQ